MAAATLIQCHCEVIGREKVGQFGPYRSVLFKLPDGTEKWKSYKPDSPELTWLNRGATYQAVIVDDELKLVDPKSLHPQQEQETEQGLTPDLKKQIASYIGDMGDLYAYCLSTAQTKIGASTDSETVRCMASSLFISASRKFQLDR